MVANRGQLSQTSEIGGLILKPPSADGNHSSLSPLHVVAGDEVCLGGRRLGYYTMRVIREATHGRQVWREARWSCYKPLPPSVQSLYSIY